MRPAQKAPENLRAAEIRVKAHLPASMRPAQKAPENVASPIRRLDRLIGFNEAGAKSAGKRRGRRVSCGCARSFNEAGAKSAGKQLST